MFNQSFEIITFYQQFFPELFTLRCFSFLESKSSTIDPQWKNRVGATTTSVPPSSSFLHTTNTGFSEQQFPPKACEDQEETTFRSMEEGKSPELLKIYRITNWMSRHGIPEARRSSFRKLRTWVERYEGLKRTANKTNVVRRQEALAKAEKKLELYFSNLEKDYPEFKEVRHFSQICTLKEVQAELKPNQVVLNFSQKGMTLRCQCISKEKTFYHEHNLLEEEVDKIKLLIPVIRSCEYLDFIEVARSVFNIILGPLAAFYEQIGVAPELIIMPDGILHGIPFGALLNKDVEEALFWEDLPYLIKSCNPVLHYSASLYLEAIKRNGFVQYDQTTLLIAPEQFTNECRNLSLTPLLKIKEIKDLIRNWLEEKEVRHRMMSRKAASKKQVLNEIANYKYILLFTHSYRDDQGNTQICLFDENIDKYDISSLNTEAEMVILASCSNGMGEFIPGEGYDGANRAFVKAGVSNVVFTLFDCLESDAKELFTSALTGLAGKHYHIALREAILAHISQRGVGPINWCQYQIIGIY